ncbi:MAG: hypothetical protein EXS32_04410 [Opitutus sp.]|nr:hypothetical protein [Opitutus sp.]
MTTSRRDRLCQMPAQIILVLGWWLGFASAAAIAANLGAGATFETLQVGKISYERVQVRSVNARSLMVSHAGGMASIRLRDLTPELQAAFGYQPEADAAADATLNAAQKHAKENAAKAGAATATAATGAQFDRLLQSFGQPPEVRPSVDLRPFFFELALNVKNQGPRPSCAVFAIVSALEFQHARLTGKPQQFSEEYLVWATCKTLNRAPRVRPEAGVAGTDAENSEALDNVDEGFALSEVVTALRTYGIPLQSSLPYTFGNTLGAADPPREIVEEARRQQRVSIIPLPGRDQAARLANLVQALDAGVPVAVGLRWPQWRTLRNPYLNGQQPMEGGGHAVTIVGYENKTGTLKDTVFIFKNSWGVKWGAGGYGFATYAYLERNLVDTALLEVQPVGARNPPPR